MIDLNRQHNRGDTFVYSCIVSEKRLTCRKSRMFRGRHWRWSSENLTKSCELVTTMHP